jgi:hypothetical protein
MGGAVTKEESAKKYQNYKSATPISALNQDKFQKLRMIFNDEYGKAAYINFLRHEESPVPNYFRGMNFIRIGGNTAEAENTLSDCKHEKETLLRFPTVAPYFDNTSDIMRKEYFARVGDCVSFLRELENVSNHLLLLMAIESIDRFEQSKSHQTWFDTMKSVVEHNTLEKSLFSHHFTMRTKVLTNTDYEVLRPIMSSRDWLFLLKACLENTPIATAICRFGKNGKCLVVDSNKAYQSMFYKTAHELYGKKLNLLRSRKVQQQLQHYIDMRLSTKLVLNLKVEKHVLSIAVASIPIMDMQGACKYMVFVCCNMSTRSFNIKELKITSDFADILPRQFHMRSEAQQRLLFPKPAKSSKPVYDASNLHQYEFDETDSVCGSFSDTGSDSNEYSTSQTNSMTIKSLLGGDEPAIHRRHSGQDEDSTIDGENGWS